MGGQLLQLITDEELDLEPVEPGLLRLAGDTLGNAATPEDGHDAVFAAAVEAFTAGGDAFRALETPLLEHFADVLPAVGDTLKNDTLALEKDLKTGDDLLKEAGVAPPAPATPGPATPSPGGRGRLDRELLGPGRFL